VIFKRELDLSLGIFERSLSGIKLLGGRFSSFTVNKIGCSKQVYANKYNSME
jgi:hypothetical protein